MASKASKKSENVRVAVRCRPPNSNEKTRGDRIIVNIDETAGSLSVAVPKATSTGGDETQSEDIRRFTFDYTYGLESQQFAIYEQTAQPIIDSVLSGYNGTIFAYGK